MSGLEHSHPRWMRARSKSATRESWQVDVLFGNRSLAEALRARLARRAGVTKVSVDPWRGRVHVDLDPNSLEAPFATLLRDALADAAADDAVRDSARAEWLALLRLLGSFTEGGDRLARPLALSVISHAVHIIQGLSFIDTVDYARATSFASQQGSRTQLANKSLATLFLSGADIALRHFRRKAWQLAARDFEVSLREQVFTVLVEQDLAARDELGVGRLLNAMTTDVNHLGALLDRGVDDAVHSVIQTLIAVGLLLVRTPGLTLLAASPLALFGLWSKSLAGQSGVASRQQSERADAFSQIIENSLSGFADIKIYAAEAEALERVMSSARELAEASKESGQLSSAQAHLFEGMFSLGFTVMATVGGIQVEQGKLSSRAYSNALYSFPQLLASVAGLQGVMAQQRQASSAAKRIVDLLNIKQSIPDGDRELPLDEVKGEIVFESVGFGYPGRKPVLDAIQFHVAPGSMVGLVGQTGSGKSSLLRLLLRLYDPTEGRILLDGHDLRELRREHLRRAIAYVSQEPYLFRGSVRENVSLGRAGASESEITAALRTAAAWEFVVHLPGGLDENIGERGQRLSGGQRQRLALARALLRRAPVLILDEATSQLDFETEAAIHRGIREHAPGTTLILVAHRLSTLREASQILVLEHGRISAIGTHERLIARDGLYASLWQLQNGALNGAG